MVNDTSPPDNPLSSSSSSSSFDSNPQSAASTNDAVDSGSKEARRRRRRQQQQQRRRRKLLQSSVSTTFVKVDELDFQGFCVLPRVLTKDHCRLEVERIWDFYEDVFAGNITATNNVLTRTKPSTWKKQSPQGLLTGFGAGWLLGNTREVLADKVFEPLYSQHELHSSKEGFRLLLIDDESSLSTTTTCSKHRFLTPNDDDDDDEEEEDLENEKKEEDIEERRPGLTFRALVVISSGGTKSSLRCNIVSSPENSRQPQQQQDVVLSTGDVLLFRSDLQVEEVYTIQNSNENENHDDDKNNEFFYQDIPAVFYCTMQPALDLTNNKQLWNQKIEAYKQRQTGTHRIERESWVPPTPPPSSSPTGPTFVGRSYFRTSPPLLTQRLAELYGLILYHPPNAKQALQRALIQGIRFVQQGYQEYDDDLVVAPNVQVPCGAIATHLVSSDPHITTGQDKYLGGMASPCGKYIYGVPGTARKVMRITTDSGAMDCIGPSFPGKFKWLRGVEIPSCAMRPNNSEEYPNGCCIALPCNHLSFLKVNPSSNKVYAFGQDVLKSECAGIKGWYYHGGNLASNGWIYCIPANAPRVVKINPSTDEAIGIGPVFKGGQKWYGGLVGSDGCIYGIPHNAPDVLKIDPITDEVIVVGGTTESLPPGKWKWHGGLVAGDKIIGFPNNSDQVLVINCREGTVYTVGDSKTLKSGRHRVPQDGRYKYLGGALTNDGRFAYFFPCDAERVMRMDCHTDELTLVGPCLLDGENKFQNGFVASDGCLYGIPQRAVGVLRIVPRGGDGTDDLVDVIPCGEDMMGVKDKFEGGVLGLDGRIYCIPLRAKLCVRITPDTVLARDLQTGG